MRRNKINLIPIILLFALVIIGCGSGSDSTTTSATTTDQTTGGNAGGGADASMNTDQTISDQAQSMTIAFDGLAFVTGSFCAQTFYPPGKVADFFGFQYLRDNDPSNWATTPNSRR